MIQVFILGSLVYILIVSELQFFSELGVESMLFK